MSLRGWEKHRLVAEKRGIALIIREKEGVIVKKSQVTTNTHR